MTAFLDFFQDHIWKYLKSISFVDILDIAVLAILIYLVFQFLRDRSAGKLMVGLGIFSAVLIVSSLLNMHAVKYILENFYQVGILALLIVFQPELRAALEKVGATPLTGFKGLVSDPKEIKQITADVESICEAACEMSRTKTGALIVLERETKLGEYTKLGVPLGAQITSALLRSIFFNKAPLHDGAVIIRGSRILAAACFLPLSTKEDILQDLGTRHRAAIGVSEVSDAVVVVVSEETGTISVIINGMIRRNFSYNTLKQELIKQLIHSNHAAKSKKDGK